MENKILNQIRVILGLQVKLEKTILSDGTEIEFENLEIGTIIKSNNEPLKEGDYILEDGRTIVIDVDGKIVRLTDYVTKHDPKKDFVRQLVVLQDGGVYYSWIKEGAICQLG